MKNSALTGGRIRQRRLAQGIKQSHLAARVGISPAYLNLIEHNSRRIGGKLLTDISDVLGVDAVTLAQGAEAGMIDSLRDAATQMPEAVVELDKVEDFAGHFPGWATLLGTQQKRITDLERSVDALSDRMAHDPNLAASLHDLLSTVTAITATSAILIETDKIEDEWRERFHRNIHEDSQRLAENSQALVSYLENAGETKGVSGSAQEELETWLGSRDFHIPELERAMPMATNSLLQDAPAIVSEAARMMARHCFDVYSADAAKMPLAKFQRAVVDTDCDPASLAMQFNVDFAATLRRIASLPTPEGAGRIGLVICDGSGTLIFRKPVDGFAVPRLGAACPLWPLYQALSTPMTPVREVLEISGRAASRFLVYAIAQPVGSVAFDAPPVLQATMLILPADRANLPDRPAREVGSNCRLCPKKDCPARREASILA